MKLLFIAAVIILFSLQASSQVYIGKSRLDSLQGVKYITATLQVSYWQGKSTAKDYAIDIGDAEKSKLIINGESQKIKGLTHLLAIFDKEGWEPLNISFIPFDMARSGNSAYASALLYTIVFKKLEDDR